MSQPLSGATRVHFIVGDPIAQVKSPAGVTQAFHEAGRDAVCIPAHVAPADLALWAQGVSKAQNVDGIIVTVPHKFSCFDLCATTSDPARFLQAVNTLRRNPDGSWHGDMFDGMGYVEAMRAKGGEPQGQRALLVGAGGAGSAIAYSLVTAGVRELAIHDPDTVRRDNLIADHPEPPHREHRPERDAAERPAEGPVAGGDRLVEIAGNGERPVPAVRDRSLVLAERCGDLGVAHAAGDRGRRRPPQRRRTVGARLQHRFQDGEPHHTRNDNPRPMSCG